MSITYFPTLDVINGLQDPLFKGTAIYNELAFSMYNYKKEPKDRLYFHQLEQKVLSHNMHVALPKQQNFLFSTLDWKIKQLVQGGFFYHWMDRYLSHSSVQAPEPEDGQIVLTMDHLSVGFTIWLGVLLIASIAFIGELFTFHSSNYFRGLLFQLVIAEYQKLNRSH